MEKEKDFNSKWYLIGAAVLCAFSIIAPLAFSKFSFIPFPEGSNNIGDTIGGIMGPFISLASAILVYIAFKEQSIANDRNKKQIEKAEQDQNFYKILEIIKLYESTMEAAMPGEPSNKLEIIRNKISYLCRLHYGQYMDEPYISNTLETDKFVKDEFEIFYKLITMVSEIPTGPNEKDFINYMLYGSKMYNCVKFYINTVSFFSQSELNRLSSYTFAYKILTLIQGSPTGK